MATAALPALSEHRYLRFAALTFLYSAQGLPWGLFTVAIPAWLAARGVSTAQIGAFIGIVALPWSFKLLAGPLMDRFTFLAMGRRRPWVLGAQLGVVGGLIVLASAPDPTSELTTLAAMGFLINCFCAMQDVAVDGMAIDILPENERARANAFMFGGQVLGSSSAAAGGSLALDQFGLGAAALIMAIAVSIIMVFPLLLREREGERLLPWSEGAASPEALLLQETRWRRIFGDLVRVLVLPMSLLLVFVEFLSRASGGLLAAVMPTLMVQELGWADTEYSQWTAMVGVVAAISGVIAGPFVDRYGARQALTWVIAAKMLVFLVAASLPSMWESNPFMIGVLFANGVLSQIVTVAIIALFMNICARKVAATQFAVYMASANLALSAGSTSAGPLDLFLDYQGMLFVAAGLNALFLLVWPLFSLEKHRARLETLTTGGADEGAVAAS